MCKFGHLHTHSEYSVLDGMSKVEELVVTAKEMGQTFISVTDHGSTSGLWDLQKACDKHGIQPILGCEFYYQREHDDSTGHLVVIAKNNKGLENLFKLQEYSYVTGFYRKPRINWDILKQHKEGLIVTSSCLGSTFNQLLIGGDTLGALAWAKKFKEVFGEDFYIELQPNSIPEQYIANIGSIKIARQLGIQIIATNDVHYTYESDCFSHEVLLALQVNKKMSDEKRFKFDTQDFWLKSEEEMVSTFLDAAMHEDIVREAMANTVTLAAKCTARIEKGKHLPEFYNTPANMTERQLLEQWIAEGAKERGITDDEYIRGVQEEVDVIDRNGYSGYYLIVADYVNDARKDGIITSDGRGSGAGSKAAYLTGITTIEPTQFNLVFERFMADGREPDFDVDFSDQDAVFDSLARKYGIENVARIIAFGTATPKAVTRKVLNAFEYPSAEVSAVTKLIDEDCSTMAEAFAKSPELERLAQTKYKTQFDVISRLEGVVTHESQHAGGVIICKGLSSILPVKTKAENRGKRIVAFDKYMLEELGHFKFDVLGLETLPIIKRALDSIESATGIVVDLDKIDYEDQNVYDMLCKGDVSGIFQINNQAGKTIEQQPRCFRDLIALNALIRPGVGDWNEYIARRRGKEFTLHSLREKYYRETFGILSYQEQFMSDCVFFAGWDWAYADKKIRKNKDIKNDKETREKFIADCLRNGHDEDYILQMWKEFEDATGDYSFCKAHATMYAQTLFKTAFLKCYYPTYFYASMMTSEGDDRDAISGYVAECKRRGIKINPPSINHSTDTFTVGNGGINYRITTIRDVGDSAIMAINAMRPIQSFDDFLLRREKSSIKQNVLVNLIKAGTFDEFGESRDVLMWKLDMSNRKKTDIKNGVESPRYEWNDRVKAEWEKDALGMYLSVHPLERYGFKPFESYPNGEIALVGGEVSEFRTHIDKKGNEMAFATVDTLFGNVKVTVFSSSWSRKQIREDLVMGNVVMIKGKRDGNNILLNTVEVLK